MKTTIYLAATAMLFFGCSEQEKDNSKPTVASTYNTTSATETFTRDNGEKALKLTVETNKMLDTIHPNVSSAQIALLGYINLSETDKNELSSVDVEYTSNSQLVNSYTYPFNAFKVLASKFEVFNQLSNYLINNEYQLLDGKRSTADVPNPVAAALEQKIKFLEKNYGQLKGFKTFGLAEQQGKQGNRAYQFQAYLEFEKRAIPYFFYIDTASGKDQWLGFSIQN
jgi:hypothetical protein